MTEWRDTYKDKISSTDQGLVFPGATGPNLADTLVRLHFMTPDDKVDVEGENGKALGDTDSAVQVIRAGALKVTKSAITWVGGAGGLMAVLTSGLAVVSTARTSVGDPGTVALIAAAAVILATTWIGLAIVIAADLEARGQATAARVKSRAEVSSAFLAGMAAVRRSTDEIEVVSSDAVPGVLSKLDAGRADYDVMTKTSDWQPALHMTPKGQVEIKAGRPTTVDVKDITRIRYVRI